ncbi:MAG: patatin family protein [Clostridia bacterium]|nr:patatin family protein [Clostridia bacterium]
MKKGLILEGGAMRGLFTAGVIDVMMEHGIVYDGAIGVSAGAAFGCNYKSGQIGRVLRYNTRFCADKRYSGFGVLIKTGNIYSTEFCYGEVPLRYDVFDFDAYRRNPMSFYVVCTDVETGEAVYHAYEGTEESGFDWIRASASMPFVSQIVEIDGRKLLDGGIADSIPVRYFESLGYDRSVVVLTQPLGYHKRANPFAPLMKLMYKQYPRLVETMANRHLHYNETLAYIREREQKGELLVIRPPMDLPVGKVEKNPERLREAYRIGREEAEKRLPEILSFLGETQAEGGKRP